MRELPGEHAAERAVPKADLTVKLHLGPLGWAIVSLLAVACLLGFVLLGVVVDNASGGPPRTGYVDSVQLRNGTVVPIRR